MKIHIKYMLSARCKIVVKEELKKLGLNFIVVDLGEVEIMEDISPEQREQLKNEIFSQQIKITAFIKNFAVYKFSFEKQIL